MKIINIKPDHQELVSHYAKIQFKGGISFLGKKNLSDEQRLAMQFTGLYGELAWYIYRYGEIGPTKLVGLLEEKEQKYKVSRKGDDGRDDQIVFDNQLRNLDIKTSHIPDISVTNKMNLLISEREFHKNIIYVQAFTAGPESSRTKITEVTLAGWAPNEDITEEWFGFNKYSEKKSSSTTYRVRVPNLRDIDSLNLTDSVK